MIYQNKKTGFIRTTKFSNLVCGFTLVEMMVAIAVFSIVMVTAMSALLNVIDANNKAKAIKTAINNVSFALEGISKDMRVGTDYTCESGQCGTGGDSGIKYRSPRAFFDTTSQQYYYAHYKFSDTQIWECLERKEGDTCPESDFSPITSSEVTLEKVVFYVTGITPNDKEQPRMIMTIQGRAGPANKPKLQTTFDLQTSVSQINREKTI